MRGRLIGRVAAVHPGPTMVLLGAVHGNEPAGVEAAARVVAAARRALTRGDLVALVGNREAYRRNTRYVSKDLNRLWTPQRLSQLRDGCLTDVEDREQWGLLAAIEEAITGARGPVHLVDLHTTSAPGIPFVLVGSAPEHREFARCFPNPVLRGLEEHVAGAVSSHYGRRGLLAASVEGGAHTEPESVENLFAACWLALARAGMVETSAETARCERLLDAQRDGVPPVLEIVSRHAIEPGDGFRMEAGFRNLHVVLSGQLLARDRSGEIRAPEDGVLVLPLYQPRGSEGFFWGRPAAGEG